LVALAGVALFAPAGAETWLVPSECPTIQAGVDSAAAGDTVRVGCDTYYEHDIVMKSGVHLTSETGESGCVTIDAQRLGRVIYCLNVNDTASIVGFTLTGGLATGAATQDSAGGGIYCEDSSLTVANCTFVDNDALLIGGGMFFGTNVRETLTHRRLWHDRYPSPMDRSGPTITDCTFLENSSKGGGGVFCALYSSTLTHCTFSGNTAERGGAMYCASDDAHLVECTFFGNEASNSAGALYLSAWSSTAVTDCEFLHNTSAEHGGAVRCEQYSSPSFAGVSFTRNVSVWSGGAVRCENSTPSFEHVEFRSNTAGGAGGGIRCAESASATLTNVTFYDNVAAHGSGVYCSDQSSATLDKCIISFGGDSSSAVDCGGTAGADLARCDVYGNGGGDWTACIAGQDTGDGNFSADPLFCYAQLGDLTLYENSPCLPGNHPDGGDYGLVGAWNVGCPATGVAETTEQKSWGVIKAMYR
jgi:predicted outer membrane repeat protein